MAELSYGHIRELDIDWYCLIGGVPTHIASMGGIIPKRFRDIERLRYQQDMVAKLNSMEDAVLNMEAIHRQTEQGYEYLEDERIRNAIEVANINNPGFAYLSNYNLPIRLYAWSFVEKARRGFRSYARLRSEEGYNEYVLIAEPSLFYLDNKRELRLELEELNCEVIDGGHILRFDNSYGDFFL